MSPDSLDELADVWTGLRRGDIFPVEPRQVLRGLLGRSPGVASDAGLRRLVGAHAIIDDLRRHGCRPTWWPPTCSAATTC